jgi:hypothetical protein
MQLTINGITLPSGFSDVLAAFAGSQPTGMCFSTNDDGTPNITLIVDPIPQGSFPEAGITCPSRGVYVISAYASQATEIQAVVDSIANGSANTAMSANLTAPNGDVVTFGNFAGIPSGN